VSNRRWRARYRRAPLKKYDGTYRSAFRELNRRFWIAPHDDTGRRGAESPPSDSAHRIHVWSDQESRTFRVLRVENLGGAAIGQCLNTAYDQDAPSGSSTEFDLVAGMLYFGTPATLALLLRGPIHSAVCWASAHFPPATICVTHSAAGEAGVDTTAVPSSVYPSVAHGNRLNWFARIIGQVRSGATG